MQDKISRPIEITYQKGLYDKNGDNFDNDIYIFFSPHDTILRFNSVKEIQSVHEQIGHIINELTPDHRANKKNEA